MDFNNAEGQFGDLIPLGTIVPLYLRIKPGGAGKGGYLTQSKTSDAQYLNVEFAVTEGLFAKRRVFENIVVSGGKQNEKNESIAANISRAKLRAILESARNILPTDVSPRAIAARQVAGWQDFEGLTFLAKIGVEKGKDNYSDKNKIALVVTPDKTEYKGFVPADPSVRVQQQSQAPPPPQAPPAATNPVPAWAR